MKKIFLLLLIFTLVFAFSNIYAQPKLIIHLTGGYNLPMGELKGDAADLFTQSSTSNYTPANPLPYYQKQGFNFGGDIKYAFLSKKDFMLKGALSFSYNMFSQSYDVPNSYKYKASVQFPSDTKFKTKMNIITIGIGPEFSFMPKGKVSPFIGADFTINLFSGDALTTEPAVTGLAASTWKSATRMGIGANFGVDYKISKQIGAVIGGRFNMINLIGKKTAADEAATGSEVSIADKEDGTLNARNMMSLDFYAGVSFFLMQPKVVVKK